MASIALLSAGTALAQGAPAGGAGSESLAVTGGAAVAQRSGEEIVVTGSRVITNGNNSPTPVTVVATETIQQVTPSNIPDGLNRLPVFSGSSNQSSLGAAERNFSGNYLNLRNVGAGRSLILFDGHRFPPTTTDNLVDTNTIPQMLIQRVDVVTGGASAVYGSDAITGVVNFITDRKFNGLKVNIQGGQSSRNDNTSMRAGAAIGFPVGDRGHFEASLEHYDSEGIDSKLSRAYGRAVYSTQGTVPATPGNPLRQAGTAANPYGLIRDTRLTNFSRFGIIKNGIFADQVFGGPNNTLRPFAHGAPTGTNGVESGGDGTFYDSTLQASLRSTQAFARFDYELTDDIHFYVQTTGTKSFNQILQGRECHQQSDLLFAESLSVAAAVAAATDGAGGREPADFHLRQADQRRHRGSPRPRGSRAITRSPGSKGSWALSTGTSLTRIANPGSVSRRSPT